MNNGFVDCKRWIRKTFKSKAPWRVYLVSLKTINKWKRGHKQYGGEFDCDGFCSGYYDEDGKLNFHIQILKTLNDKERTEALLHEFAHVLQFQQPNTSGHDEIFQNMYKKILRRWESRCI